MTALAVSQAGPRTFTLSNKGAEVEKHYCHSSSYKLRTWRILVKLVSSVRRHPATYAAHVALAEGISIKALERPPTLTVPCTSFILLKRQGF